MTDGQHHAVRRHPIKAWSPQTARLVGGAAILGVLVWRVGAGPFVDGLRVTSGWAVGAAVAVTAAITVCCAWRWTLVAAGLGVQLPLPAAVGACYRSEFLNSVLPGGILGDVHRGVRHGRDADDLSRGLRSVAWERTAGQTVQIALTVAVLLTLAAPAGAVAVLLLVAGAAAGAVALRAPRSRSLTRRPSVEVVETTDRSEQPGGSPRPTRPRWVVGTTPGRLLSLVRGDLQGAVLTRSAAPGILLASVLAVAGHVAIFALAVLSAGVELPPGRLVAVALVVLQAAALPANVAGWGPREAASAWAFGFAGVGAASGVTVAVVYGVLALLATVPGAVLLLTDRAGVKRPAAGSPGLVDLTADVGWPTEVHPEGEVRA